MESVSKQEYMRVLSKLDMLTNKFVALEHENQRLFGDLQHVRAEKAQQYEELSQWVHQLEVTILSLRDQASGAQNSPREPKISLPDNLTKGLPELRFSHCEQMIGVG